MMMKLHLELSVEYDKDNKNYILTYLANTDDEKQVLKTETYAKLIDAINAVSRFNDLTATRDGELATIVLNGKHHYTWTPRIRANRGHFDEYLEQMLDSEEHTSAISIYNWDNPEVSYLTESEDIIPGIWELDLDADEKKYYDYNNAEKSYAVIFDSENWREKLPRKKKHQQHL